MIEFKTIEDLELYRGDIYIGLLKRNSMGCEIQMVDNFLADPQYDSLSYRIPKKKSYQHSGDNLPAFFAGLLPEGIRFRSLVNKLKTSEDDYFSLLAATGTRTIGDIFVKHLGDKSDSEAPITPKIDQVNFYDYFQKSLTEGLYKKGDDAVAGVQEKISASMISFPINIAKKNKSYILKLNPKDKSNLVHNEKICLELAKKCGLDVNKAKLVYDKDQTPGLLVERFDRIVDADETISMVHQEDACQFLNRYPADKYRLKFQDICRGINELATAPQIEILKALQLYAFSYLVGNGDLHAKNISLQTDRKTGRIQLTPSYDLICTYIYGDQKMALKLGGRDDNMTRKSFIEFAAALAITDKAVHLMLDKLIAKFEKYSPLLFEIPMLTQKEEVQLRKMILKRTNDLKNK